MDFDAFDEELLKQIKTASSLKISGEVIESQGAGQTVEIIAKKIVILGDNFTDELEKTVLQPKKHSLEVLREQAHLRFRTNLFGAVFRVRSAVSFAIHQFFNQKQFYYINTPIITGADAEGAGEMFQVTNFDLNKIKDYYRAMIFIGDRCDGTGACLYIRTNLPGRKFQHHKTSCRILDGRARGSVQQPRR